LAKHNQIVQTQWQTLKQDLSRGLVVLKNTILGLGGCCTQLATAAAVRQQQQQAMAAPQQLLPTT
jgi:hypothetical protein